MTEHNNPIPQADSYDQTYVIPESAPVAEPAPSFAPAPAAFEPAPQYAPPAAPAPTYAPPAAPAPTYAPPAAPTYAPPAAPAPTYAPPAAPTYSYPAPTGYAAASAPAVDAGTKAKGFVGMGLAIGGLVMAIIGIIACLASIDFDPAYAFGLTIGYGIFSFPLSIVGRILCNKSQEAGNTSGACSVGSKLGMAGLIVSIVMMGIGFIALLSI